MILNKKTPSNDATSCQCPQQLADEAASDPPSPEGPPEDGMESRCSYASSLCGSGRNKLGRGLRIG